LRLETELPIEVELGCGDGLFMVDRASANRDWFHLGLDIREQFLKPGRQEAAVRGLTNVALDTCNLIVDIEHLFSSVRVSRFFINFPDPFFKRRQHHRRWLTEQGLDALVSALHPGGELIYQSDVWDPTVEALGLFELNQSLQNTFGSFSFSRQPLVEQQTSREQTCLRQGRKIWRLKYRKRPVRERDQSALPSALEPSV
jgi:tRNA (guanine-N7-)-methyltransferase